MQKEINAKSKRAAFDDIYNKKKNMWDSLKTKQDSIKTSNDYLRRNKVCN